ncbi:MAG: FAD:protein FMN transferase [Saprospiraceae bacterium]|nr:FAD:protein FMN transferase [Saprospiraceae bacterium]
MKHLIVILILFSASVLTLYGQHTEKKALSLMGTDFEITVVARDQQKAQEAILMATTEIKRIESLISSWDPDSQTSLINQQAGIAPVAVDAELFNLIKRSLAISQLTDGAFDISFAGTDKIWSFDGKEHAMPSQATISESVSRVGYEKIQLDDSARTVFLPEKGMKIAFGAIGKGYAADRAKQLLQGNGIEAGIINASGDLASWGMLPEGKPWTVAITNPLNPDHAFGVLPIHEGSVVTSGNYEKYALIDGLRYAHIIDPRSGLPSRGIVSATVFCGRAELGDALATSLFVIGVSTGLDRINQMPGVECIIVDDNGTIHTSKNIRFDSIK